MKEIQDGKREIFICDCHSIEHQFAIWYDEEDNELWLEPHLDPTYHWYKRLWGAIKYIFGYKTMYGNWDSVMLNPDDLPRLREYFDKAISINEDKAISINEKNKAYYENLKTKSDI
jgi:hypothetical protein